MAISRVSLVRGPALCTYKGGKFYTKEDFEIKIAKETLQINTSAHGKVDERAIEISLEASITPEGRWSTALINSIWAPFANMVRGASLLTATDVPFVASASDGQVHTIVAACVTKLPDIKLSAKETLVGSMTVKGYRSVGLGWTDASSLYTIGSGGSLTDSTFTPQSIIVQPYTGVWGSVAGFGAIDTEEGWTISFNLTTKEIEVNSQGKIDVAFDKIEVMAKCIPIGPTAAQLLTAADIQGALARGHSLQNDGSGGVVPDLVITGLDGTSVVTLKAANLKHSGYAFGATKLRDGEIGFVSTRPFTAGVQQPIFALAAAA